MKRCERRMKLENSLNNSYKESGVDVTAGYKSVELIKKMYKAPMIVGF